MRGVLAVPPFLVLALACAPATQEPAEPAPPPEPPAVEESAGIAAMTDDFIAYFNAGDIDSLVAMYAEDARVLPPNAPMGQGHEAVREVFAGMSAAGLTGGLESVSARAAGNIGYHVGVYWLNDPDGNEVDRGKYLEVWERRDGEWKMVADMFSSDLPVPGSE